MTLFPRLNHFTKISVLGTVREKLLALKIPRNSALSCEGFVKASRASPSLSSQSHLWVQRKSSPKYMCRGGRKAATPSPRKSDAPQDNCRLAWKALVQSRGWGPV